MHTCAVYTCVHYLVPRYMYFKYLYLPRKIHLQNPCNHFLLAI